MSMNIDLEIEEQMALAALARQERRDARNQAAWLIRQELERRGLLPQQREVTAGGTAAQAEAQHGHR